MPDTPLGEFTSKAETSHANCAIDIGTNKSSAQLSYNNAHNATAAV
jgi:hypothetical protein